LKCRSIARDESVSNDNSEEDGSDDDNTDGSDENEGGDEDGDDDEGGDEDSSGEVEDSNNIEDDVWTNPSTDDILMSIITNSADEVKLIKPGSRKPETFALRNESQRDELLGYLKDPEVGSKWRLWPRPKDDSGDDAASNPKRTLQFEPAETRSVKKAEFIKKIGSGNEEGTNDTTKTSSKKKQRKSKKDAEKGSRSKKQKCVDVDDDSKEGKHHKKTKTEESKVVIESDDDCYGGDDLAESLAVEAKTRAKGRSFEIHVSKVFEDSSLKMATVVALYDPGDTFYEKAEHIETMVKHVHKKKSLGKPPPSWMSTIKNVNIRAEKHGLSTLFKRTEKNKTIQYVLFVYQVPLQSKTSILDALATSVEQDLRTPFLKRNKNTAGELVLKFVEKLPKGKEGGLEKFCLMKGAGNRKAAAAKMTEELDDHYGSGATYVHGCCLDKFMVDYDMKVLAEETFGMNSWEEMDEGWKSIFFKKYPSRELPKWDEIMQQSY